MVAYDNSPAPRGALADRWPEWVAGRDRRASAALKLSVYEENHLGLILQRIANRVSGDPDTAKYISRFALRSPNLTKAVTDTVAVPYRRGARRELRGVSESVAKAFTEVLTESGIDRKAEGINARGWIAGPISVSPHLDKRNRLALDTQSPDQIELRFSSMGGSEPEAALWLAGATWIELDEQAWRYYNLAGELTMTVPHAVGECPLVPFVSFDNTSDFWTRTAHSGLIDATLEVSFQLASMLYVREVSSNYLTVVNGDISKLPGGQTMGHHGVPVYTNATPQETKIEVHNRIVPAKDYLEVIGAIITTAVSDEGIPPGSVKMVGSNSDWGNLTVAVEGSRLGTLRDKQVKWLVNSERNLWPLAIDLIRGSTHRHARILPPSDEIRDMLRVTFPDLAEPKDEIASIEAMVAGLPYGLTTPVDYIRARRPELTGAEAEEEVQKNLAVYINVIEPLVNRNVPKDAANADGYQTLPQKQGREGGIASGESRNEESES